MLLTSTCPVMSLNRKQRFKIWKAGLANCLQRVGAGTMQRPNPLLGNDVLRLIHSNGYLIVPPSNPPTPQQIIYQIYQRHLAGTQEASTAPPSSLVPVDVHSTLQLLILKTPFRGIWAKPLATVAMPTVSPWCTRTRCYLKNAGTIGFGHRRRWQLPMSGK